MTFFVLISCEPSEPAGMIKFERLNQNLIDMKQRILTFTKRFNVIDQYGINLDEITQKLNANGWCIKQIVSTAFSHKDFPVLSISILVEKDEE